MGKLAVVCWCIWCARNRFIFERFDLNHRGIAEWACKLVYDFLLVSQSSSLRSSSTETSAEFSGSLDWSPPPVGTIKVNCGAAVKNGSAAIACAVCDNSGFLLDGFGKLIAPGSSVLVAEAVTIREACVFFA
ncbi:hypothetical protein LguiA_036445 [Lonicera macranthoides]